MAIAVDHALIGSVAVDSSASTISFVTSSAVSAGGFIVLVATWFGTATASSMTVTGGLTWTIDKQGNITSTKNQAVISAQAPSGLATTTTLTLTLSGSSGGGRSMAGISFTGVATSSPVDGTPAAINGTSASAWATNSASLSAGSVLVGGSYEISTDLTSTPSAGTTEWYDINGGAGSFGATGGYRIEASSGNYTLAGTWSGFADQSNLAVAYKASAGGGGGTTVKQLAALGVG